MKPRKVEHRTKRGVLSASIKATKGGLSVVHGVMPVLELLKAENRKVEKILVSDGVRSGKIAGIIGLARKRAVRLEKASRREFSKYVDEGANHQGVIAITAAAEYYDSGKLFNEITQRSNSVSLILDGIEDPRNFGAILRTAEAVGIDGVFIQERRAVGLTDTVAKSSAGATEYVKVAKVTNINRLIDELKANGVWVVGTSGEGTVDYTEWDWKQPTALVLGREGKGMHRLTAEKCDVLVKIPLYGKIESLNVSVAAGVILFEAVRQRGKE